MPRPAASVRRGQSPLRRRGWHGAWAWGRRQAGPRTGHLTDAARFRRGPRWVPMRRGESGQAIVEAAFVLPAMVFLILCAIQLAQIQQARLLAEYAASNAARAGIVHSGDPGVMHDAALLSVLPSAGRTDDFKRVGETLLKLKARETILSTFGVPIVRVFVHGPRKADFARYGAHLNGREIDFDDVRPGATEATLLEIQVRYLYEMHVPFANKLIQTIWMATHIGSGNRRALDGWKGWDLTSPKALVPTGRPGRAVLDQGPMADPPGPPAFSPAPRGVAVPHLHRLHQPGDGRALRVHHGGERLSALGALRLGGDQAALRGAGVRSLCRR